MKKLIFILFILINEHSGCKEKPIVVPQKDWWETAQFYQIYPRSFMDSNSDGIGDLNGITSKLEYLKEIGVTAAWLSPIFKSPMVDFGYDISNFYEIQTEYGTMKDFENLVQKAHKLGLKIILDFVPNHSSDENEWFIKSVNNDPEYRDFYVWHDGYKNPNGSDIRLPPSNWLQGFRGSAWKWNDKRKQFYLHQFAVQQPDFNYRNPAVVERMSGVLKFWLDKGVDGFRCDTVPSVFEVKPDEKGNYPDEPKSNYTNDPDESAYLDHIYTQNQPETIQIVYEWHKFLDDYQRMNGGDSRVLLIETYAPPDYTMQFYGNRHVNGAQIPFNFNLITNLNEKSNAKDFVRVISMWLDDLPTGRTANWVIGNHDQRRAGSRYGANKIDTMNMLIMMLPGVSVTYQGEEIGMLDGKISWEDTKDPAACNSNSSIYEKFTRDPSRTPFQWSGGKNAGFSDGNKTWLPLADTYKTINVDAEKKADKSHLKLYKSLIELRKRKTLLFGNYRYAAITDNVLVIQRHFEGKTLIMAANLNNKNEQINLTKFNSLLPESLEYRVVSETSKQSVGKSVNIKDLKLEPFEAVILDSQKKD